MVRYTSHRVTAPGRLCVLTKTRCRRPVVEELNDKITALEGELMDLRANLAHLRQNAGPIGGPDPAGDQ